MASKKPTKHSFTPEIKAEALRRISEEGYTIKQAADYAGCSVNAISTWKAAAKKNGKAKATKKAVEGTESAVPTVKKVKKTKKVSKKGKKIAKTTPYVVSADVAPCSATAVSFDEFVRDYWSGCEGATDVLSLPPELAPRAVEYVNNVLRFAHDRFAGE